MNAPLLPLFDSLQHIHKNSDHVILPNPGCREDFHKSLDFLRSYQGSLGTFNSYRREVERLLQWTWLIKKQSLSLLKREDIEAYLHFCQNPPLTWIGVKKVPRYLLKEGKRIPNTAWRPFITQVSKSQRKQGHVPKAHTFALSQGAIQEIFAILSTFFNFLISEEYVPTNPVALIRQKSKFIRKRQQKAPIRRLSLIQWENILAVAETMAAEAPHLHERTLFMLSLLFGMYLRISELAANERWTPLMNHFYKDNQGCWWFITVGKGNKERQIAVSDALLKKLIRWRTYLGLTPLPSSADNSPLLPKVRGHGPLSDTAPIRRLIQRCFDRAYQQLREQQQFEEADNLLAATVHWLRHTGISEDVKIRPREHVRDDAGHSSSATTDRYIDVELLERYRSAQGKVIGGEKEEVDTP